MLVRTDKDVSLVSGAGAAVVAEDVSVSARSGEFMFDALSYVGRAVECRVESLWTTAREVEQTVRTLTQRLRNAFRFVEEHEEVQTNSTRYLVEDLLAMHTKNTDLTSEEIVKVTADQIHLG